MAVFKDKEGMEWTVEFNLVTVDHVKQTEGIDLFELGEGGPLVQMELDQRLAATILFRLCEKQVESRGMSVEDFFRRQTGDTLDQGIQAVRGSAVDFFPQGKRPILRAMIQKMEILRRKSEEIAARGLETPDFEKKVDQLMQAEAMNFQRKLDGALQSRLDALSTTAEES